MNLIKIQDDLKNLSDQQLFGELQSPSGAVPSYLVLSELDRRKNMRAKLEKAPSSTVADDLTRQTLDTQDPQAAGIASLMPNQAASEATPQAMARGGIVKMADGGESSDSQVDDDLSYLPDWQRAAVLAARARAAQIDAALKRPSTSPSVQQMVGENREQTATNPEYTGPTTDPMGNVIYSDAQNSPGGIRSTIGSMIYGLRGAFLPPGILPSGAAPSAQIPQSEPTASSEQFPIPPIPPSKIATPGIRTLTPGSSGGMGGTSGAGGVGGGRGGLGLPGVASVQNDPFTDMRTASQAERNAIDDLLSSYRSERESAKDRRENAKWESLLHAGLNMMAAGSKTGNALGAIGAGAAAGAQQFSSNLKDIRKDQREDILDELKARQLKLDSLYKQGTIDYHQFHEQNALALGQARIAAAQQAGRGDKQYQTMNAITNQLREISAEEKNIQSNFNLSPAQRQAALDDINRRKAAAMSHMSMINPVYGLPVSGYGGQSTNPMAATE